jgi:hypothetical protein
VCFSKPVSAAYVLHASNRGGIMCTREVVVVRSPRGSRDVCLLPCGVLASLLRLTNILAEFVADGSAVCHFKGDPHSPAVQTELAAFLVAAGQHSYYMCSSWSGTLPVWYPVYDMKIGAPLGNATLGADKIWRRSFVHINVTYNTVAESGQIEWGGSVERRLKSDDGDDGGGRVTTTVRPEHSWATLPVAWHSALSDAVMSPDAVKNLSKFPLITLEKSAGSAALNWKHGLPLSCENGTDLTACGCCEEDLMITQARQIKALNPKAHIVAYFNSIIAYPWYRAARKFASNSSWWLRNSTGGLLNNIRENPTETWRAWNFADEAVGELWIEMCLNVTKSGVIDGCFMDGCANENQRLIVPGPLTTATEAAYRENKPKWMAKLQKLVPGILICGSGGGWVNGDDGKPAVAATQVQNWGTHSQNWTGVWMPMLFAAVKAGVIFEAHAPCGSSDPDDPFEQSKLAAFLIAAGEGSYYLCGGWGSSSVPWYSLYDLPLGKPLSDAKLGADGVWRRSFAAGTNVTMDTKTNNGTITWAKLKRVAVKTDDQRPKTGDDRLLVWPPVQSLKASGAALPLHSDFTFVIDAAAGSSPLLQRAVQRYAQFLAPPVDTTNRSDVVLKKCTVRPASSSELLRVDTDYSYALDIDASASPNCNIVAPTVFGCMAGLETFTQLLNGSRSLGNSYMSVTDHPDFVHRGVMIDAGRRFAPLSLLFNVVEVMSWSKMNVLHLHASDMCRWSVESLLYPQLNRRSLASGDARLDAQWLAGYGTYTQTNVTALLNFARDRGVRVIVETDMPGHAAGLRPLVGNDTASGGRGLELCNPPFTNGSHIPNWCAVHSNNGSAAQKILPPLVVETAEIFKSEVYHIGGDEVRCNGAGDFEKLIIATLEKKNVTAMAWSEVLHAASANTIIQAWRSPNASTLAANGVRGVDSEPNRFYLSGGHSAPDVHGVTGAWCDLWQGKNGSATKANEVLRRNLQGGEIAMVSMSTKLSQS